MVFDLGMRIEASSGTVRVSKCIKSITTYLRSGWVGSRLQNGTTMEGAVRRGDSRAKIDGLGSARGSCVLSAIPAPTLIYRTLQRQEFPSALPLSG